MVADKERANIVIIAGVDGRITESEHGRDVVVGGRGRVGQENEGGNGEDKDREDGLERRHDQ